MILASCTEAETVAVHEPKNQAQWLNPLFYNNDFEHEINFPIWFDDSLVKAHKIYKITKRLFGQVDGDTSELNSIEQAIPKEKIEYYFDPNGLIDQIVVYSYYDDREIARANFIYEGNMMASGYRKVRALPFITLSKKTIKDEFTTELILDKTQQYSFLEPQKKSGKFQSYIDLEKGNRICVIPKHKNWSPLSVDSIVHPTQKDWIIQGSTRKPYKRYKVENLVTESNIYLYTYWKSGLLKKRVRQNYPFEQNRTYLYNAKSVWSAYIDSTFSEKTFVSRTLHNIYFDEYDRPKEIIHRKMNGENSGFTYRETINYRSKLK